MADTVYLQGPPKLSAMIFSKIVEGEVAAVDVELTCFVRAYKTLAFADFCEQQIRPVMEQLFPESE